MHNVFEQWTVLLEAIRTYVLLVKTGLLLTIAGIALFYLLNCVLNRIRWTAVRRAFKHRSQS